MSEPPPLPDGFAVGHWSDPDGRRPAAPSVIPPPETPGGVGVHGGGPGTRETDTLGPLANAEEANAILITGGSAFGLAAADGVARWLEEHERGYLTPGGRVPLVPAAVIYDLPRQGDPRRGPAPRRATRPARRPRRGAGARARSGPGPARRSARSSAASARRGPARLRGARTGTGQTVAAIAAVNAAAT